MNAGQMEVGPNTDEAKSENVMGDDDAVSEEDDQLRERRPRVGKRPYSLTKAEVEKHMPLHVHYRSWCPHCRAGRSISRQHRRLDAQEEPLGPVVSIDYAFKVADVIEAGTAAILVAYDHKTKAIWALEVEAKGVQ